MSANMERWEAVEFRTALNGLAITIFVPESGDDDIASHFKMQAGPCELPSDPRPFLRRAIEALQVELAAVDNCPVHRQTAATHPEIPS